MEARVYLADLRHNYSGVLVVEGMPIGVAYMKAVMDRDLPAVESRVFAYPDRLLAALESAPPDVLMLSNYMWNEALSHHFATVAKRIRPDMLVVMGGPNIMLEDDRQIQYLRDHPDVDVYALGEGDFLATEIVKRFLAAGKSVSRLAAGEIPSAVYRRDGDVVRSGMWDRAVQIDDIPSPWLTGVLDEFFDGKLAPMMETNRGCPFQCTFCVQGVRWYTKVHNFTVDRIREEIDYVGRRVREACPSVGHLIIADSNYGMFERDIDISACFGEAQQRYGWPTYINATTGKNRPERIIRSLEKVNGAIVVYQAVQSMDEETLRNVKRSNISKDAYEQVMIHVRGRGLRSMSDLILGLPGETLGSHLAGINELLDAGTHEMHLFQAMMLKGSELETVESRTKYRFDTRFRLLPKSYGVYGGENVFDLDEIVVATDTLTFDDYLEARRYALTFTMFWNNSWFEDVAAFARSFDVKPSEFLRAMRLAMEADRGEVKAILDEFIAETRNELFPTREACVAHYQKPENFERLLAGDIGDNLMYKYRALAAFFRWPAVCRLAMDATRALVVARGAAGRFADFDRLWADFHRYVEAKHAHGSTAEEILSPVTLALDYDVPAWIAAGMPADTRPFLVPGKQAFVFALPPDAAREIDAFLKVWTTNLLGLSKGITRIRTTSLVRTCRPASPARAAEREALAAS